MPRIPFAQQVKIRFADFDEFVTRQSRDLSLTGMFLQTSTPHPPGSSFEFEVEVEGGQKLIRGVGEVMWAREQGSEEQPSGMGIQFVSLDEDSRRLIHWLIDRGLASPEPLPDETPPEPESG